MFHTPPSRIVLLRCNRRPWIPIGAPQSGLVLQYVIQRSSIPYQPQLGAPLFHSRLLTSLPFGWCSAWMAAPLDMPSSTPVGAHWPLVAPLNYNSRSSINISTRLAHLALHIRHTSFPGGAPLFPQNSSYCLSNSILIHCELTSQFQPFRYDKSSQATLEFNFTHSPGSNHSEIHVTPPASLRHWWIVCCCICQPWWDGRFRAWHWNYVRLISCDWLVWLLLRLYLRSFFHHSPISLVLLTVAMHTIECWMRCCVL